MKKLISAVVMGILLGSILIKYIIGAILTKFTKNEEENR